MRKSFHESIKELKNEMLKMGSMVEEAIHDSVKALKEQDLDLATQVMDGDDKIDDFEVELEERCTRLIALQQPVAKDLRTIIVISKLATDLERIGDHASNIARMVHQIGKEPLIKPLIDIPRMTEIVTRRLRESLDAFVNLDIELAKKVAREDEEVDILDEQILRELLTFMIEDPSKIRQATSLMFVSRFLERIGDHSTNICERVIYMVSGERKAY
ncbi:phosphate signaling complex protein PhoU [Halothermothrix orenii]|uniref:Phosphate-specific transport system accessory protein PhoU n=1 Tax=Halothermothrix orenii (strain H 168 / OCM 544 / DSM 9562) TaxID=373903 RepID=B8D0G3_HALOH|nr:phosphate uptake regulator, PhoU [Halothermothrix orenii H 168]